MKEIKEGENILKIRVLLGNAEFNIYVKLLITFLVSLMCFFLVIRLSVYLLFPIPHSCYHLF